MTYQGTLRVSAEDMHHTIRVNNTRSQRLPDATRSENLLFPVADTTMPLIATTSKPVVMLDSSFRIRSANHEFCSLIGIERTICNGTHISALGRGEWNQPTILNLLRVVQETKSAYETLLRIPLPDHGVSLVRLLAWFNCAAPGSGMILLSVEVLDQSRDNKEADDLAELMSAELAAQLLRSSRDIQGAIALIAGSADVLLQANSASVQVDAMNINAAVGKLHNIFQSLLAEARRLPASHQELAFSRDFPERDHSESYTRSPAVQALARTLRQNTVDHGIYISGITA